MSKNLTAEQANEIFKTTVKNCPVLYTQARLPMSETCMCWGWEMGYGWFEIMQKYSYMLEHLNNEMRKYRCHVEFDQTKEKFGTLTIYESFHRDAPKIFTFIGDAFEFFAEKMREIDYHTVYVTDEPERHEDRETEYATEQEWLDAQKNKFANDKFMKTDDGKFVKISSVFIPPKRHIEARKHKILYKILRHVQLLSYKLDFSRFWKPSKKCEVAFTTLQERAAKIIHDAEEEAYNTCMDCGTRIGTSWSPRCCTSGWVTYICEDCAEAGIRPYTVGEYKQGMEVKKPKRFLEREAADVVAKAANTQEMKLEQDNSNTEGDHEHVS